MTVLEHLPDVFVELVSAMVDESVQVTAEPPAEGAGRKAIFLEEYESRFQWLCLGAPEAQEERVRLRFIVKFHDEATSQRVSSRAARVGAIGLLGAVQAGVMNGSTPHQLEGTVSWGRVASWHLSVDGADKGWVATGRGLLEATYYP